MSDAFAAQAAEFDALDALIKSRNQCPGIVDDFYPEWRHGFENKMHAFFEAAAANGRFKPNSRFGMRQPTTVLLRQSAGLFRHYQKMHEDKYRVIEAQIATMKEDDNHFPARTLLADTHEKARVNAEIATKIEAELSR